MISYCFGKVFWEYHDISEQKKYNKNCEYVSTQVMKGVPNSAKNATKRLVAAGLHPDPLEELTALKKQEAKLSQG